LFVDGITSNEAHLPPNQRLHMSSSKPFAGRHLEIFDVRSTSLADSPRLYQRKLAGQRKVLVPRFDARRAALKSGKSRALSLYIGSACCNGALLREHHGRCSGNREKRYSRNSGE
jgi:hypothetical protein